MEGSQWILLQHKNCVFKRTRHWSPRPHYSKLSSSPLLSSAQLCSPRLFLFKMNYPINFVKSSPRPAAASQFCGFPIPTGDQGIYFSFVDTLIQYNWPLRRIYHSTQTRKCPLFLFSRDRNLNQKSSILISLNSKLWAEQGRVDHLNETKWNHFNISAFSRGWSSWHI